LWNYVCRQLKIWIKYFRPNNLLLKSTAPFSSPQQNGLWERKPAIVSAKVRSNFKHKLCQCRRDQWAQLKSFLENMFINSCNLYSYFKVYGKNSTWLIIYMHLVKLSLCMMTKKFKTKISECNFYAMFTGYLARWSCMKTFSKY
jgi:hypothetical protein